MGRGLRFSRDSGRRRRPGTIVLGAVLAALVLSACGGGGAHFKNEPRPAVPVDLSVYIDNGHVSISPTKVGAGPVILYITNQASGTQTLAIKTRGGSSVASSGHINSGSTAQINTSLKTGTYDIASGSKIPAAKLTISKARKNADNVLLAP
jgi:hypothetical protein